MGQGDISSEQVNSVVDVSGGTSSGKRDCFNRGREDHFARDRRCPAEGRKCDIYATEIGIYIYTQDPHKDKGSAL